MIIIMIIYSFVIMDDLDSFFKDFSSESGFQRTTISTGAIGGRTLPNPEIETREFEGIDYAEPYKEEEEKKLYEVKR
jgi:hypothetical protein